MRVGTSGTLAHVHERGVQNYLCHQPSFYRYYIWFQVVSQMTNVRRSGDESSWLNFTFSTLTKTILLGIPGSSQDNFNSFLSQDAIPEPFGTRPRMHGYKYIQLRWLENRNIWYMWWPSMLIQNKHSSQGGACFPSYFYFLITVCPPYIFYFTGTLHRLSLRCTINPHDKPREGMKVEGHEWSGVPLITSN